MSAALDPRRNLHEIAVGRAKRKARRTRYASYTSSLEWREYSNGRIIHSLTPATLA